MNTDAAARHLGESELLHLLDEDASSGELALWRTHVRECAACTERLDELHDDSERVRVAIARVQLPADFPTAAEVMRQAGVTRARRMGERPGRHPGWLRLAAAILLVLLPLALITPLRAALVEWVRQGWSEIVGADTSAPPPVSPGAAAEARSGYTVWFTPTGPQLEILVESRQATGELVLVPVAGADGSLEVRNGDGEATRVDESGLSIRNGADSRASYQVAVPGSIERVRVRVADEAPAVIPRAALSPAWRRDLSR